MNLGRKVCKSLIRDAYVCDARLSHRTRDLVVNSTIKISTDKGDFEFRIKYDRNMRYLERWFCFKRLMYTVELRPIKNAGDNHHLYVDKVMVARVIVTPRFLRKSINLALIDVYLDLVSTGGKIRPSDVK